MTHGLLGALGALVATFGLLALALHLLRRMQHGAPAWGRRGVALELLQRTQVGPKQGVVLLRVAERVLVVSVADAQVALLTELTGADRDLALGGRTPAAAGPASVAPTPVVVPLHVPPMPALRPGELGRARVVPPRAVRRRVRLPWLRAWCAVASLAAIAAHASAAHAAPARGVAPSASTSATAPRRPATSRTLPASAGSTAPAPAAGAPVLAPPGAPGVRGLSVVPPLAPKVEIRLGDQKDGLQLSGAVGLVVFLGALTLLPALFLLMTSFTRILIVLHFLRSALGTQTTPPGQLLVAVAVLLTGVVMNPTLQEVQRTALQPYFDGRIAQGEAYTRALQPFREFMLANTREHDLDMFAEMGGNTEATRPEQLPTITVMSAFVTSELRTAFQMGFVIFLPFVVVDVIVASVLMSMGMFMLPPMMVSLPFKLLLFVLADGWTLVVQNLVASFHR